MKKTYLYEKLEEGRVKCLNCAHYCLIDKSKKGICGARENQNGKLYALNYGKAVACHVDPIEKKPFFHFLPGTRSLSIAAAGCNFRCLNCQNWDISQRFKNKKELPGEDLPPEAIVKTALENNLPSISYTYTEPAVFLEYALDTMVLAKEKGLKNAFVSNGFISEEAAKLIIPHLNAINIDIKGFSDDFYRDVCGARLQPVLDTAKLMKKSGIWLEITTLIIPTLSDSEATLKGIAGFIKEELGTETPWHVSSFSGAISWKLRHLPDTSIKTLEKACGFGKAAGLKHVYTGNIPGLSSENTFCPKCRTLCINRTNYIVRRYDKQGKCPKCGENLNIIILK